MFLGLSVGGIRNWTDGFAKYDKGQPVAKTTCIIDSQSTVGCIEIWLCIALHLGN